MSSISTEINVTWEQLAPPFDISQTRYVAILEQIKKRIRKKDQKLVPADIVQPISYLIVRVIVQGTWHI